MKEDNHRHERAKKILAGRKKGGKAEMLKKIGKKGNGGLSGAEPKSQPVGGVKTKTRMDKRKRYATGGGVEDDAPKKKTGSKTEVNIVIAGKGDQGGPQAVPVPIPAGGGVPVGAPPARPPIPPQGMPPGGMPPGMPMRPPGAMRRGGGVKEYPLKDGSRSGEGRLEKAAAEKKLRHGKEDDS